MPDAHNAHHASHHKAAIGPNALTQLFDPIRAHCGEEALSNLLHSAGITTLPNMLGLIDEVPVIRFHTHLHHELADKAKMIERQAGIGTAEYILANRIPKFAQFILKALPAKQSATILTKAISKNAWTFTGSGDFKIINKNPLVFEIYNNPLVRDIVSDEPLCVWHEAVFETLFQRLVSQHACVRETSCCAMGDTSCQFEISLK